MMMPDALVTGLEKLLAHNDAHAVKASAAALSMRYRTLEKQPNGARIFENDAQLSAYLAFRMPATFSAVSRALQMALECGVALPATVTDVGSGSGSAIWALHAQAPEATFYAIEREAGMIDLSRSLLGGLPTPPAVHFLQGDMRTCEIVKSDWVTASYCIGELAPAELAQVVPMLWQAAGQALLLVEPGTPAGFERICASAKQLVELGAHITAPCPGFPCPVSAPDWCHFSARLPRTKLHRYVKDGALSYEDEKFTFLLATRAPNAPCAARIRRRPTIYSGYVDLELCTDKGLAQQRVSKKSTFYKAARKAEIGDAWAGALHQE